MVVLFHDIYIYLWFYYNFDFFKLLNWSVVETQSQMLIVDIKIIDTVVIINKKDYWIVIQYNSLASFIFKWITLIPDSDFEVFNENNRTIKVN